LPRFPYIDTLKITEKFGPGSQFYGFGSAEELDDLERRLEGGERFLALFTEFPGNPLLRSPDLERIRKLADKYDFCVVVDETIGNFINVNVLPYADVVVSSLTKVFSGDSNVMGGGYVLFACVVWLNTDPSQSRSEPQGQKLRSAQAHMDR
jgi:cystathionine gamma-synthase